MSRDGFYLRVLRNYHQTLGSRPRLRLPGHLALIQYRSLVLLFDEPTMHPRPLLDLIQPLPGPYSDSYDFGIDPVTPSPRAAGQLPFPPRFRCSFLLPLSFFLSPPLSTSFPLPAVFLFPISGAYSKLTMQRCAQCRPLLTRLGASPVSRSAARPLPRTASLLI